MSIAEMMLEDPMGMAMLHGVPPSCLLGEDFEEMDGRSIDEEALNNCMKNEEAEYPTLILDDGDSCRIHTPSLMGIRDRTGMGISMNKPDVQVFWRCRGAVNIDLGVHSDCLIPKLIRSKNFTSIVLAGHLYNEREKDAFANNVIPLLVEFVNAGGYLVVQDYYIWWGGSNLRHSFPTVRWTEGGDARRHGVHLANLAETMRIFPESASETNDEGFYAKGSLLKDVPANEAFFSSREEGYSADDHVLVAIAQVGKGKVAYFGTYNMHDTASRIRSFLQHDGGLLKKRQFQINCQEIGLWNEEIVIERTDLDRGVWWKNSYEEYQASDSDE